MLKCGKKQTNNKLHVGANKGTYHNGVANKGVFRIFWTKINEDQADNKVEYT